MTSNILCSIQCFACSSENLGWCSIVLGLDDYNVVKSSVILLLMSLEFPTINVFRLITPPFYLATFFFMNFEIQLLDVDIDTNNYSIVLLVLDLFITIRCFSFASNNNFVWKSISSTISIATQFLPIIICIVYFLLPF